MLALSTKRAEQSSLITIFFFSHYIGSCFIFGGKPAAGIALSLEP
jgi:hypothetical protein